MSISKEQKHKFTALWIKNIKETGDYADPDCENLYLQVTQNKKGVFNKSWIFRYSSPVYKKRREQGLGSVNLVNLADARHKVYLAKLIIQNGGDPINVKDESLRENKLAKLKNITFAEEAKKLIENKKGGWKNSKHHQQWVNTLETYVYPLIGNLPIQEIQTDHIEKILSQPIKDKDGNKLGKFWDIKTETATRVRQRIEMVINVSKAHGRYVGENPARLKGHIDIIMGDAAKIKKRKHQPHPALPYIQINSFISQLREKGLISHLALEFLILTASRTAEVRLAEWSEIDFEERIWTIPKERMKAEIEHKVPLSKRAIIILKMAEKYRINQYIFPGHSYKNKDAGLSDGALSNVLKKMSSFNSICVVHGFRSTFMDWASEETDFHGDTRQLSLAHTIKDKSEDAYRRMKQLEKRRKLMELWSHYIDTPYNKTKNFSESL